MICVGTACACTFNCVFARFVCEVSYYIPECISNGTGGKSAMLTWKSRYTQCFMLPSVTYDANKFTAQHCVAGGVHAKWQGRHAATQGTLYLQRIHPRQRRLPTLKEAT